MYDGIHYGSHGFHRKSAKLVGRGAELYRGYEIMDLSKNPHGRIGQRNNARHWAGSQPGWRSVAAGGRRLES